MPKVPQKTSENEKIVRLLDILIKIAKENKNVPFNYIVIIEYFKEQYETNSYNK